MTKQQLLESISNADFGRRAIRAMRIFKLQEPYFMGIQRECLDLYGRGSFSRVEEPGHVTNWVRPQGKVRQFSLLNVSGDFADTSTDHNYSCEGKRFCAPARYPMLAAMVASLPHCINFRLSALTPKSCLSVHKEHVCFPAAGGAFGIRVRFHLPIQTNQGAEVILENQCFHFEAGEIFFFNQGCIHGARNNGEQDRLHLVWDMLLTHRVADMMFGEAPPSFPADRSPLSQQELISTGYEAQAPCARLRPLITLSQQGRIDFVEPQ